MQFFPTKCGDGQKSLAHDQQRQKKIYLLELQKLQKSVKNWEKLEESTSFTEDNFSICILQWFSWQTCN